MKTFKELLAEDAIDYVVVQLPLNLVDVAALRNEGRWVPSTKNGWMERVEAENPAIKQMSHVHVARSKHINNKNMQE